MIFHLMQTLYDPPTIDPSMKRISVLIGAGAVYDASLEVMDIHASTEEITHSLFMKYGHYLTEHNLQARICKSVIDLFKDQGHELNFEDIYHLMHQTLISCENNRFDEVDRCVLNAMQSSGADVSSPESVAVVAKKCMDHVINAIVRMIEGYNMKSGCSRAPPVWFSNFFRTVSETSDGRLDICNLNYDSWIEDSISCNDGFIDYKSMPGNWIYPAPFRRDSLIEPGRENRMLHIHGCIWYYFHGSRLAKYDHDHIGQTSGNHVVSKSGRVFSPIVTGREKEVSNLVFDPFLTYLEIVENQMVLNDMLVIIGYGFGDEHINKMVRSFRNGSGKDLVIIGPSSDDFDSLVEEVCGYRFSRNEIIRESENCLWYAGGFRDAISNEYFMGKLIGLVGRHSA